MTYYLWVLRNGGQTIVVDTGFSAAGGQARGPQLPGASRSRRWRASASSPGRVDTVINTHLHYDHTGHLDAFGDTPVLVNRTEFEFWTGPSPSGPSSPRTSSPARSAALAARVTTGAVTLMDRETVVAPGVTVVEVGGHSPGQSVVFVGGSGGTDRARLRRRALL